MVLFFDCRTAALCIVALLAVVAYNSLYTPTNQIPPNVEFMHQRIPASEQNNIVRP